jgi:hypothetical protein
MVSRLVHASEKDLDGHLFSCLVLFRFFSRHLVALAPSVLYYFMSTCSRHGGDGVCGAQVAGMYIRRVACPAILDKPV